VQGIYFRAFIQENAEKLNLVGFVRNLDNGKVEAFVQGDSDNIDKLIEMCKKPKNAKIDNIEIKEEKLQEIKGFKILHI
jgi:acylphosphatase